MLAMVVDDNDWILNGITSLLKSTDLDLEVHGFNNVQEALTFASQNRPPLVIADVEMPTGNGLEMCNKLMAEYSPKLIIISGHDRFQYAQQAIALRAVHYVLKPLKQDELLDIVRQVVMMIKNEEKSQWKHTQMMKEKFFMDLATGRGDSTDEYLQLVGPKISTSSVSLCLLHIENHALLMKIVQGRESTSPEAFQAQFRDLLVKCPDSASYCEIRRGYYLFMVFGETSPFEKWLNSVFRVANANQCVASAGMSDKTNDPAKLADLYKQAVQALQKEFTDGSGKIHRFSHVQSAAQKNDFVRLYDYSTRITNALASSNAFQLLHEEMDELFDHLRKSNVNQEEATLFCRELLLLISMQFMHMVESKTSMFHSLHEQSLKTSRTLAELKTGFAACLRDLHDNIHHTIKTKSDSVKLVVDNMLQSDCASVSLDSVAEKLNVHPTYLSILFKESVGVNFKDYVLEYKIKSAIQMLTATDRPVYSISDKLGYMDSLYFSKIFKKQTGMTPVEYRRLHSS